MSNLKIKNLKLKITSLAQRVKFRTWVTLSTLILLVPLILLGLFSPKTGEAAWYDTSYLYRAPLTIDNSASSGTLTNFPVLVKLESTNFDFNLVQSDGDDIRFTDSDGVTLIDYDLEKWDTTNKVAYFWVEVPSLTNSASYRVFMYFGNATASSAANSDNTWNSNYMLVQHLDETSGTHTDSTSNNNDSTSVTVTNQGADIGKIDGADNFDGTDDVVQIADSASLDIANVGTIETWVRTDTVSASMSSFNGTWTQQTAMTVPTYTNGKNTNLIDATVVGNKVYYSAYLAPNATSTENEVYIANSNIDGTSFSSWTTLTDANSETASDAFNAVASSGTKLYYAVFRWSSTSSMSFTLANSDLDGSNMTAWSSLTSPDSANNTDNGQAVDIVISGSKIYYAVAGADDSGAGNIFISHSSSDLDGTNQSSWTTFADPRVSTQDNINRRAIQIDTDGEYLYYAYTQKDGGDSGLESPARFYIAKSNFDGTGFSGWTELDKIESAAVEDGVGLGMVLVGKKLHFAFAATDDVNNAYYTASSNTDGSSFSGWTSQTFGCVDSATGANDPLGTEVVSDGKTLTYVIFCAEDDSADSHDIQTTTASVTSQPVISKADAYELIHSGGGIFFDWAGAPSSFGTVKTTEFAHVAITQDGSTIKYFINGTQVNSLSTTVDFAVNTNNFRIGGQAGFFDGVIDEVRISDTARSSDWLKASYNSGNNTMVKLGAMQEYKDPVGWWKLDEGRGTSLGDTTTNANSLTLSGATWQTKDLCIDGSCLFFDGADDNLTRAVDSDFDFNSGESFTIQSWFRHEPVTSGTDTIIAKGTTAAGYKLYMESDGDLTCGIADSATFPEDSVTSTAATYDDNRWHLATCVKNGSTSLRLYIDGIEVGTADTSIAATGSISNALSLYIGIDGDGISSPWEGFLDEIKIYPYARSATQIYSDFVRATGTIGASAVLGLQDYDFLNDGLVGYWRLDETSGNASDSSGNSLTLTNNGVTTFQGAKFGNGTEHVPASSQYFSTATSIPSVKTVSFWVNPDSTTNHFVNLASGIYINASSGTISATGFTSPTIYVNGAQTSTLTQDVWQLVTITTNTEITADAFNLGRANGSHFDGTLDEARVYNRTLSGGEILALYNWAARPVALWRMDENTGTTTNDSSSNANNSSAFTGNTAWTNGKYGPGLTFDGDGDVVRFVESTTTDLGTTTDSYTISGWIKTTTNSAGIQTLAAKDDGSGAYPFALYLNSSEQACFQISDGTNSPSACGSTALNDGLWHHLAGRRDVSADTIYIYVDGELINSTADTTTATTANNDDIAVGNSGTSYVANDLTGQTDNVILHNYARSQGQIIEEMNGLHPTGGSPVGTQTVYWKFDEMTGTTTRDSANATVSNGTITNASYLTESSCKINGCLSFDAAGERVAIATANDQEVDFAGTEKFSGSAWVYITSMPASGENDAIIAKWDDTNNQAAYRLVVNGDSTTGHFDASIYDESASQEIIASQADNSLSTNTWYHVAWTFNGGTAGTAGDLKLYVNGKFTAQNSVNASFLGLEDLGSDFTVGEYDTNDVVSTNTAFTGYIDEVKIYASELSAQQVGVDMNANASVNFSVGQKESALLADGEGAAPKLYLQFNEGTGTSAFDSSGNGNTGTLTNTATWKNGKYGSGVYFDGDVTGDDTHVRLSANIFDGYTTGTIEGWFKSNDTGDDNSTIFSYGAGGGANIFEVAYIRSTDTISIYTEGCDATNLRATGNVPGTQTDWHHFAVVISGTNNKLYIDGMEVTLSYTSGDASNTCFFDDIDEGDTFPTIGCTETNSTSCLSSEMFEGMIDEFKIYDYARSASQVAYGFSRGTPTGWWKFDECKDATSYDSGSKANNGTINPVSLGNTAVGTCSSGTSTHMWHNGTTGKRNSSIDLDGTDDYINIPSPDLPLNDFSYAAWVNLDSTSGAQTIFMASDGAGGDELLIQKTSGGAIAVTVNGGSADVTTTRTPLSVTASWVHVTVTRSGSTITVYFDAKADATTGSDSSTLGFSTCDLLIGADADATCIGTLGEYWNGKIDDARVYPYALSVNQIKHVMNEGAVRYGP